MSVIYKIYSKDDNVTDFYIGSTNNLQKRKLDHKTRCLNVNSKEHHFKVYAFIRSNGGFEHFDFRILEQFDTLIDKNDLHKIERKYIESENSTLNSCIPIRTPEERLGRHKKYHEENKDKKKVKIECEFCKRLIRKHAMKRHQRSNRCIECKSNML